ncbi:ATP-dependent RNA helicase DEAH11, chloroplastic-like [Actinidia eriantha]|uniref:ATP-dependent RNA helicase DEAH11, chloroplastic-like n=1 Tax=Actinidia eriantha TaxID=165200 RepID=UPI002588639F|nr:ATP-dependent RNA helicase DEAH11, chloroplastic-like [Actinidia eriantha]
MNRSPPLPITARGGGGGILRRGVVPANFRSYREWKPQFTPNQRLDRPPGPYGFTVELRSDAQRFVKADAEAIIAKCKCECKLETFEFHCSGSVAASLYFHQWIDALEATVYLWGTLLDGTHSFTPRLVPSRCDMNKLWDRLKALFADRVKGLMEGDLVKKWKKKLGFVVDEISGIDALVKKHNRIHVFEELSRKKAGLESEKGLIERRIKEFKSAMKCILNHLEGTSSVACEDEGFEVFRFSRLYEWVRIHCLIRRECRRLEDGLPIYAFRREILQEIYNQQVLVLIGETGSGKSTQLVQFLADSGVAANNSIICTQPRKLAAISLAQRVREESCGCYQDNSVISYPTYASAQHFNSKVIYMTDHCLLQHYMKDKKLSGISCIIVDEAHERSLNSDLLLTLIKNLLRQRHDLRLIIMSATADANQLAEYFFGCGTFHVVGRNFPVDIRYVPCESAGTSDTASIASYASDVVRMVTEIHRTEKEGTILAFLTSQMEVEWAREKFKFPSAVALALHGKLSHEDQIHVFLDYPGKRKVIFATNVAETSLTIPGVKYVVDSGMVKESRFEPGTGMNVLKVCRISQSSANQRAGRAGRTEPGRCYRLYSECDFELMPPHQEPEIRRVHLGVAVLRILALGVADVQSFDFVDAPCATAIEMAVRNLIQLGAIVLKNDVLELTKDGLQLVRLGIEPRLGKIILQCFENRLGKEGLVLAAVMANASSIFCRVGNEEDKLKSDCLKVQFCHRYGDLFTLLSVYKEWEGVPREKKNLWCWENSINAKSMRRCQDTVTELETCLQNELNLIIPSYWRWNPQVATEHDKYVKKAILSSLAENVAMYSGYDQLGYEVALTGKHVQLHPSCSLLIFGQRPSWVVFGDLLSVSSEYLVCVTAFDYEDLPTLCPPPLFDTCKMGSQKLQVRVLTGFGCTLLKKFCGKSNNNLHQLVSHLRTACTDERIGIEVNVDRNEIQLFASSQDIDNVICLVHDVLEYERKWLQNECMEKCLYHGGPSLSPSVALFGAGAEIKHLELEKRCLTVDVFHSNVSAVDDKELLAFLERMASGSICAFHKFTGVGQDSDEKDKWGRITFLTPDAAKKVSDSSPVEFNGDRLDIIPSLSTFGRDHKMFSFAAVRAKVHWPRRSSKGLAIVKCDRKDVEFMVDDFSSLVIGGKYVRSAASIKYADSVVISGLDRGLSEAEILDALRTATDRKILDFFLVRGDAVENPPCRSCEEALLREISPLIPKKNPHVNCVRVQVFPSEPKDAFMRAMIMFDGSLHLEAAKALEEIEGKVLPGCLPWQKIKCQQLFNSSVSCPAPVYLVIKEQLDNLLAILRHRKGAECHLDRNENGSYRVKISANATKTVADLRRPLEQLMRGKTLDHPNLTPTVLQLLFSRDGITLLKTLQRETGTCILFDRHKLSVRIFGSSKKIDVAEQRVVQSLLTLHESKQLEIHLRGGSKPPDLMKEVVKKFGPELQGLREKFPDAEFTLNSRRHIISIFGNKELKQKVEDLIFELVETSAASVQTVDKEAACPICLCEVEDGYQLESCTHMFCRLCLVEQCESAIKSQDSFPMRCMREGCGAHILLTDLRSLLSGEKLEELFRASLGAFVASSGGAFRFCPSPDCPSVYRVADPGTEGKPFVCGACYVETCTRCHLEYHPFLSCEKYQEFKDDPDSSLKAWCEGKDHVKNCPICRYTIEKIDGCNHIECRCGKHICWVCLAFFASSDDCYGHLRSVHQAII